MSDQDNVELVVVTSVKNTVEAELIVNILEDAGIPAAIDGRYLQDDFAIPQKMLGVEGVKVRVRKQDLAEAQRVLAEVRKSAETLDDEYQDLDDRDGPDQGVKKANP